MSRSSETGPVLPSLTLGVLGETSSDSPSEPSDDEPKRGAAPGDVIGARYIIDGQIGRGGMGRVLKVRHLALDKAFALKLPKAPSATKEEVRERFYREARLASCLSHENICSIVDFGDDSRFGLFMVMELLEGTILKKKLGQDGRMTPKAAADVISQIAEAMSYVHSRGIIHGDIKSENIMLVKTPDRHRMVKLLDFGLARMATAEYEGQVRGTPEYLSPEQICKKPASVASDIYALGILFYELLIGEPPFTGERTEVMKRQLEEDVPAPSKLIKENLDERADLIIQRATAKDPSKRHPSVSAFLYELRAFCNMHGIDTRRRGSTDSATLVRQAVRQATKAAAEVYDQTPIPLAAVTRDGTIRVANRAFLDFLGIKVLDEDQRLPQTPLMKVYPTLVQDLAEVASSGTTLKRTLSVSAGAEQRLPVAIILSAPPAENAIYSGDIHVALHPLAFAPESPYDDGDAS